MGRSAWRTALSHSVQLVVGIGFLLVATWNVEHHRRINFVALMRSEGLKVTDDVLDFVGLKTLPENPDVFENPKKSAVKGEGAAEAGCRDEHPDPGFCENVLKEDRCDQEYPLCKKSCNTCHVVTMDQPFDDEDARVDDDEEEDEEEEEDEDERKSVCEDEATTDDFCANFASYNGCTEFPKVAKLACSATCDVSPRKDDPHGYCKKMKAGERCDNSEENQRMGYHNSLCEKSCGVCTVCEDRREDCADLVENDPEACESNPGYFIVMCAKTCNKCDLLDPLVRCTPEQMGLEDGNPNQFKPGDISKTYESLKTTWPSVEFLSTPPNGPWMALLPNFVTDLEISTILNHTLKHVKRSTDQGDVDPNTGFQTQITSSGRTSSNAWCTGACEEDPIVSNLESRIAQITHSVNNNFESFQVLQYKLGQKYDVHHDEGDGTTSEDNVSGPRVFTFFIYMSDVEEGGETDFPLLNIKVKPRKGYALLWPSVLDEDPSKIDHRTKHAALPVIKGTKYAANVWIHLRDFKTANYWGCTGAFD